MFNSIGFLTYFMREGREQLSISFCEGRIPMNLVNEHPKRFVTNIVWSAITILLHFSFWLFNILYKYINRNRYLEYQNFEHRLPQVVNKENLHMYVINIFAIIVLILILAIALPNNIKHPSELGKYPTYLTIYFEHCIIPNLSQCIVMMIFFVKNKRVSSEVWESLRDAFDRFRIQHNM